MRRFWLCFVVLILGLSGCNLDLYDVATPAPVSTPIPIVPAPTATPDLTSGWQTIAPGMEQRIYIPGNRAAFQLMVIRVDPAYYTFRAHYQPGTPMKLEEWRTQIPTAAAFVNANFFNANNMIEGLLVADGVVHGRSYIDRGGTFFVMNGEVGLRSNLTQPYRGEAFEQAVQAFPMLIEDSWPSFLRRERPTVTRRTAIGVDSEGRVLLIVTPLLGVLLSELSVYLAATDMNLVTVMNLDGGGSSMMRVNPVDYSVLSFDPVPSVLAIYPRY